MKISRKVSRIVGVGAALLAVVAFSAIALASSASAAIVYLLAEWLNKGVALTSTVLGESVTEILLEDTKVPAALGAAVSVICKGRLDGDFGADGGDDVTEVLNEAGTTSISTTALSGAGLSCAKEELCESSKVWAVNLPWLSVLELWEEGGLSGFVDLLTSPTSAAKAVGWYVECTILGVKAEDECTTPEAAAEAPENLAAGVLAVFSETVNALFGLELATCTQSKAKTGVVEAVGIIRLPSGGPLAASE
jgi:hypothetical protein